MFAVKPEYNFASDEDDLLTLIYDEEVIIEYAGVFTDCPFGRDHPNQIPLVEGKVLLCLFRVQFDAENAFNPSLPPLPLYGMGRLEIPPALHPVLFTKKQDLFFPVTPGVIHCGTKEFRRKRKTGCFDIRFRAVECADWRRGDLVIAFYPLLSPQ